MSEEEKTQEELEQEALEKTVRDNELEPEFEPEPEVESELESELEPELESELEPEPKMHKIVHNGQVHEITEEKYLELAQKGFDYDFKVGPHARIAKLLESDPKIGNMVNEYVEGKLSDGKPQESLNKETAFKVKPIDEYETADEWLKDNISEFSKQQVPSPSPPVSQKPTQQEAAQQLENALKMHDPHSFAVVYPKMIEQLPNLTISQYQRIDADVAELFKFYDSVKANISDKGGATPPPGNKTKTPPFKIGSGKATPEKQLNKKTPEYVWNLPNSKFDEIINRAKGFM